MIDPYQNFEGWFSSAKAAANNALKFCEYYSKFEAFLTHISQTGFLPEPISNFTLLFMEKLATQFCNPILSKEKTDN